MDPVTHMMTGAVLSRAGLNRNSAYTTVVMVLAAEAPDLDTLWRIAGPVAGFQHHRGWTHSLLMTPLVSLVTVAVVLGAARLFFYTPARTVNAWWLLLCGEIAALSHIALDWSNNYGIRLFWPFSTRWYEGDQIFILEPLVTGTLLIALLVPAVLGLADREISRHSKRLRGRGWAIAALTIIGITWTTRAIEHHRALNLLSTLNWEGKDAKRVQASPYPLNPFRWHGVADLGDRYQTAIVNTKTGNVRTDAREDTVYKPAVTPGIRDAEASRLGRAYLDWSPWPLVTALAPMQDPESATPSLLTPVEFQDMRFDYPVLSSTNRGSDALHAYVLLGPDKDVLEQRMGGSAER